MTSFGKQIRDGLEQRGEAVVREAFLNGEYGSGDSPHHTQVREWLRSKEGERAERKTDLSLSNSENAVSLARRANTIAIIAMILSAIIAIIQMFK